ncbi:MAG TPA: DUF134 domain-containing protein [Peptococcaceae bacterium]|nr:DUF134 domain-containing protein [Peptococcaceae bacterium]
MPRPIKRKLVCGPPVYNLYAPVTNTNSQDLVVMSIEEFEAIRLIDYEGLDQEHCAERMEVARSTVQRLYNEARRKIAESLVQGKALKIEGGCYSVCSGDFEVKKCGHCWRHQHGRHRNNL